MKKNIILLVLAVFTLAGCNLDRFPHDQVSAESMQTVENALVATNGNYALFKSTPGYAGDLFIRHNEQLHEYKSDNVLMSGKSTDVLFLDATFMDSETDVNTKVYWAQGYRICYSTSAVINVLTDDVINANPTLKHVKGENLVMRAIAHMLMSEIFSYPYSFGRDNPGIVIRIKPMEGTPVRATVGEVYDQIEKDLKEAITCMTGGKRRGDNGYIDVNAAKALLARLYLHEERWQECIDLCDDLLSDGNHLDPDYEHLFQFTRTSEEVIWCVANSQTADDYVGGKQVGQMFYSASKEGLPTAGAPGENGWGEIYYSQPLLDLFERYPADKRLLTMREKYKPSATKKMIYWPVDSGQGTLENNIDRNPVDNGDGTWTAVDSSATVPVSRLIKKELVNTYPRWYFEDGGKHVYVSVTDSSGRRATSGDVYPVNYCKKYVHQDGNTTDYALLSSPAMLRYAEVILNRAEAYAHIGGKDAEALNDVNTIRHRAGLTGSTDDMSTTNIAERGYASVLDVVLDERRMELCFEGFRTLDLQRNKKQLDRRYAGMQPNEVYEYNDPRIIYMIPQVEIDASGLKQNVR